MPEESSRGRRTISIHVHAETLAEQLKRARVEAEGIGAFHIFCDEPASIGGSNSAPAPLMYFAASLAF